MSTSTRSLLHAFVRVVVDLLILGAILGTLVMLFPLVLFWPWYVILLLLR